MDRLIDTSIFPDPLNPHVGDVYGRSHAGPEGFKIGDGLPRRVVVSEIQEDGQIFLMVDGESAAAPTGACSSPASGHRADRPRPHARPLLDLRRADAPERGLPGLRQRASGGGSVMSPTPALIEAPPRLRTAPALARAVVRDLCHQDGISAREQPALEHIKAWRSSSAAAGDAAVVDAIDLLGEREAVRVYEGAPRACKLTAAEREKLARAASRAR
jgi:hypothetical protein